MRDWQRLGWAVLVGGLVTACGGQSASDGTGGTGGTSAGATGGSATGGSGGTGATGGTASGGTASGGTGACGPMPGGVDCLDQCTGMMYSPYCDGSSWTCGATTPCADAGSAGGSAGSCAADQVPTSQGCLTCALASQALSDGIEAARKNNAQCSNENDCVLTASNTACAGSCGVAVSQGGESAFQSALKALDAAYCSGFVSVCGYSTPKCAQAKLVCNAGLCEATY